MDNKRILKDLNEKLKNDSLFSICMSCSTICTDDQELRQSCPRYRPSQQGGKEKKEKNV